MLKNVINFVISECSCGVYSLLIAKHQNQTLLKQRIKMQRWRKSNNNRKAVILTWFPTKFVIRVSLRFWLWYVTSHFFFIFTFPFFPFGTRSSHSHFERIGIDIIWNLDFYIHLYASVWHRFWFVCNRRIKKRAQTVSFCTNMKMIRWCFIFFPSKVLFWVCHCA